MVRIALFGVMCAMLALGACVGAPSVVFDESVPAEESIHIYIDRGLEITAYNGIPVPTRMNILSPAGIESDWHNILLPAGETEFILDMGISYGNTIYTGKNITFRYTFEPSGDYLYYLRFTPRGGADHDERGIIIYKQLPKETAFKAENEVAFIPFSRPRTILQ